MQRLAARDDRALFQAPKIASLLLLDALLRPGRHIDGCTFDFQLLKERRTWVEVPSSDINE